MKQLTHQKADLRGQLDEVLDRVRRAGDESKEKLEMRDALNGQIAQAEQKGEELTGGKEQLIELKYKHIANREKLELARETYQTKLWDDYGLTLSLIHI